MESLCALDWGGEDDNHTEWFSHRLANEKAEQKDRLEMENKDECPECIKWMTDFVLPPPFALLQRALLPPAGEVTWLKSDHETEQTCDIILMCESKKQRCWFCLRYRGSNHSMWKKYSSHKIWCYPYAIIKEIIGQCERLQIKDQNFNTNNVCMWKVLLIVTHPQIIITKTTAIQSFLASFSSQQEAHSALPAQHQIEDKQS